MQPEVSTAGNTTQVVIVVLYFIAMFLIGYLAMRRVKNTKDFFLGGKRFGPWFTAFKFASTWESGIKLVGTPGQAWNAGWSAFAMGMATPLCYFFSFRVFGQRLKVAFDHFDVITVPQLLGKRYGSKIVRVLAAVTIIIGLGGAMIAQYKATGEVFSNMLGMNYTHGLIIGAIVVGLYSIMGGYLASVWTDFIQGIIMVVGTIILFVAAAQMAFGGLSLDIFSQLNQALANVDPNMLTITGGGKIPVVQLVIILVITLLVGLALPQQSVAIFSMRDLRVARSALVICTVFSMILAWTMLPVGMMGRLLLDPASVPNPDAIIPMLVGKVLSPVMAGIFIAAILAAIMSTVGGSIMVAAATLTEDVLKPLMPRFQARHSLVLERAGAAAFVIVPLLLAIRPPAIIFWIGVFAFGFVVFTFLMPMAGVIFIRRAGKIPAIVQMLCTMIVIPIWALALQKSTGIPALLAGLVLAPVVFIGLTLLTGRLEPARPEIDALWKKFDLL